MRRMRNIRALLSFGALAVGLGVALPADAHFVLVAPDNWMSQDSLGLPEKAPPCGDEGGGTATNLVTAYRQGDSVTVTIDEKVFHPGHYRIALAVGDRSTLPPEPVVTPDSTSDCGSVPVQDPPVFPVLADNVFPHTTAFSAPMTTTIKLPDNVTCTKCTLQVIEFMSDHALNVPGGCFYHHCADISISPAADAGSSMTTDAGLDAGAPTTPKKSGCSLGDGAPVSTAVVLACLALFVLARRRSA